MPAHDMRLAFVVQLGNETSPATGSFEGWVAEVDSCTELRFRSAEELLNFLGQRFELAMGTTGNPDAGDECQLPDPNHPRDEGEESR